MQTVEVDLRADTKHGNGMLRSTGVDFDMLT